MTKRWWWLLLALLCAALMLGSFALAGRYVSTPVDEAVKADLILSLGGDNGSRIREAQRLYAEGYAPRILLTGIEYGDPRVLSTYLGWRAAYLTSKGVPINSIVLDNRSGNTWEEAENTMALMRMKGWNRVLVVSDPPHMRRLSWVWAKVFHGSGLNYRLIASPMPEWEADVWWRDEKSAQYVLTELIKLVYYFVRH